MNAMTLQSRLTIELGCVWLRGMKIADPKVIYPKLDLFGNIGYIRFYLGI